jgi:hypothetical protein
MNTKKILPSLVLVPILLVGCGSDDPEVNEATGTSPAPDSAPATEPEAVTVTVTAEPEPDETETTTAEPTAENTTSASPTETTDEDEPTDEETDFGEAVTSDRGNLVKEIGQVAGVMNEDTGDIMVEFTPTDVETDFSCNNDWSEPSENGQYVAFTFEVETFPALSDDEDPFYGTFGINEFNLTAFSNDGERQNDITGNSWMCLDESESLPADIGPGQKAEGKVVIDTALESGILVFSPLFDGTGWEWKF